MILRAGDPNLSKVETEDSDIGSPVFEHDLNKLLKALKDYGGMGIAAPQIGIKRRLLLIESKPNERYPFASLMDLIIMVNPVIVNMSSEKEFGWEGCLSVPEKRVKVERALEVEVEYSSQDNELKRVLLKDFPARVFLHEFDHLEGFTILDRATEDEFIISEEEYFKKTLPV